MRRWPTMEIFSGPALNPGSSSLVNRSPSSFTANICSILKAVQSQRRMDYARPRREINDQCSKDRHAITVPSWVFLRYRNSHHPLTSSCNLSEGSYRLSIVCSLQWLQVHQVLEQATGRKGRLTNESEEVRTKIQLPYDSKSCCFQKIGIGC